MVNDDPAAVLAARLAAQWLSGPPATVPEAVVGHLLAVQAQDLRGARLAVRARTSGVVAADVDDALTRRRSLVVAWLNRGTLHMVRAEDYWWLFGLVTPQLAAGNARRLSREGVSPAQAERATNTIVDAIRSRGPLTRAELRAVVSRAGVPVAGQALVHVLFAAACRDQVVRGPMREREHCFVVAEDWIGPAPRAPSRREALARLARRYLGGHGPATAADLAKWAGIRLSDARLAIEAMGDEIARLPGDLFDLTGRRGAEGLPRPRLLGPFDPVLHGWATSDLVLAGHREVVTVNGLFRPFAMVEGHAVATWGLADGTVTLRPFETLSAGALDALRADAATVMAYLGLPFKPAIVLPAR